jgi:hypothetical protein
LNNFPYGLVTQHWSLGGTLARPLLAIDLLAIDLGDRQDHVPNKVPPRLEGLTDLI